MLYILPYDGQRTILQLRYNDTIFYHIIRKHKTTPFSEIIFLERENMSKFKKKLKKNTLPQQKFKQIYAVFL